jgi:hypothetical protein
MAHDEELNLRALNYLMTAVIHRMNEADPVWWRDFLQEMKGQIDSPRLTAQGEREMLTRAIRIVEHSLKS